MPAPLISKQEVLARLMGIFREQGYEGASLTDLSEATGLGRSSLYHYFPGGKDEMATSVLAYLDAVLEKELYAPLATKASPKKKLDTMLAVLNDFYDGGAKACLLERLCASAGRPVIGRPLRRSFEVWLTAFETLGVDAGISRTVARTRAEDALARIEGALVVSAGTGNKEVFARALKDVRTTLLSANEE
jgi:TetR/AcrR family transcriptional regulator, lmrAB and yxaGH operons repressor